MRLSPGNSSGVHILTTTRDAADLPSDIQEFQPKIVLVSPDLRGPLAKQGPRYLRWALVEAATHACTAPIYRERYQHTKARIGKQRGAKVAQVDIARRLAEAIWYMLTRNHPFAPTGATPPLAA